MNIFVDLDGLPFSFFQCTPMRTPLVSWCDGIIGAGRASFAAAVAAGHEGVVAKRLNARYSPGKRNSAWRKIKQVVDLPCVVIGYKQVAGEVRSLLMATLRDGKLTHVDGVELGVPGENRFRMLLDRLRRRTCAIRCSEQAHWVEPKLFCVVRCHGWRPGGGWRDPVVLRWEDASVGVTA